MGEKKNNIHIKLVICWLFWCILPCRCSKTNSKLEQKLKNVRKKLIALRSTRDEEVSKLDVENAKIKKEIKKYNDLENSHQLAARDVHTMEVEYVAELKKNADEKKEFCDAGDLKQLAKLHADLIVAESKMLDKRSELLGQHTLIVNDKRNYRNMTVKMFDVVKQLKELKQEEEALIKKTPNILSEADLVSPQ